MSAMALGTLLSELADEQPDAPVITFEGTTITRSELDRTANRLARAYAELGVTQGDMVTIGLPNGPEFVAACAATWKLGAIPQPVSPSNHPTTAAEGTTDVIVDDLHRVLEGRLVRHKVPRTWELVDEPVRDDAGKVRRTALADDRSASSG